MKKIVKFLLITLLLLPMLGGWANAEQFKPATLINFKTGYRVAVYSDSQAQRYFSLGYELDKGLLGFSVVTNYSTTLSSSITATQTTIPVGTTKDKKGEQLATSTLGMKIYLNIEPGGNKEELVVCTGISGDSWTGCTRGLAFSGTDESAVSAYQFAHSAGSRVVMSNIHYVYNQFVDKLNPLSESTYTPTTDYNLTTKTWVETRNGHWEGAVANFAALPLTDNADGAARVTLDDSKLYVWASSTASWNLAGAGGGAGTVYIDTFLGTDSTGGDNQTFTLTSGSYPDKKYLQVYLNGILMEEGATNDYVATSSNAIIFNDAVLDDDKITMLVVSVDLYNPAWNAVNADILPDVDSAYDIGSAAKKFKDGYFSGDLDTGGSLTIAEDLNVSGTTKINNLLLSDQLIISATGTAAKYDANSTSTVVYTHNLGKIPYLINFKYQATESTNWWTGNSSYTASSTSRLTNTNSSGFGVSSSYVIYGYQDSYVNYYDKNCFATVSNVSTTTFSLDWVGCKTGAINASAYWEAYSVK